MKLKEAKEIVDSIIEWQFVLQGIKERKDVDIIDLSKYSLEDLIKANKLVKANNSRKQKLQEYYHKKGCKTKSISIQMVLADKLIAGVYSALNFTSEGQMEVLINDRAIAVVTANYR